MGLAQVGAQLADPSLRPRGIHAAGLSGHVDEVRDARRKSRHRRKALERGNSRGDPRRWMGVRPDGRNHAWIGVSAFRALFLAPLPRALLAVRPVWALVGWLYSGYHARAADSCLRGLAASPELGVTR